MGKKASDRLRIGEAAAYLGVHPATLRNWERAGKIQSERVNARGDRRFRRTELDQFLKLTDAGKHVGIYCRVSRATARGASLEEQERVLRAAATDSASVQVFTDIASGLNENRKGLTRLLNAAQKGEINEVLITHRHRITRFGFNYLEALLHSHGVHIRALHPEPDHADQEDELLADFLSLLSSFSGSLYGHRSHEARMRLLREAGAV
jgi:putative resolvase